MEMWLVGKFIADTDKGRAWAFQGIFSTREKAIAACRDKDYSVQSCRLDEELPHEDSDFPDGEYPKLQT